MKPSFPFRLCLGLTFAAALWVTGCRTASPTPALSATYEAVGQVRGGNQPAAQVTSPVQLANWQEPEQGAGQPPPEPQSEAADTSAESAPQQPGLEEPAKSSASPLQLSTVLDSVTQSFPPLLAVSLERDIALGDLVAAWGAFDLQLKGESLNAPLGFYENYRHGVSAAQPVWNTGGQVWGGYKLGRGEFQPWFKERQTNEGGELAAGLTLPLLRNRDIDNRRTGVGLADLDVQLADPFIRSQLNVFARDAAVAYWDWVAAGNALAVQRDLLELAELRADKIEARVREGDLPDLASVDNQRFITARQTKLVELEQKFRAAAVKLSLYLRDETGEPLIARAEWLAEFPAISGESEDRLAADIAAASAQRPELLDLDLQRRKLELECRLASNATLPTLDAVALTSQDVGGAASNPDDKGELEFEAGVLAEVPLQRRAARGKIAALQGKLSQLDLKRQYLGDRIAAELRAALVALENLARQIGLAERNLALAEEALRIGRASFDEGNIDLIVLNIYEQSVADARLTLVLARHDWFAAFADYQLALGQSGQQ